MEQWTRFYNKLPKARRELTVNKLKKSGNEELKKGIKRVIKFGIT